MGRGKIKEIRKYEHKCLSSEKKKNNKWLILAVVLMTPVHAAEIKTQGDERNRAAHGIDISCITDGANPGLIVNDDAHWALARNDGAVGSRRHRLANDGYPLGITDDSTPSLALFGRAIAWLLPQPWR